MGWRYVIDCKIVRCSWKRVVFLNSRLSAAAVCSAFFWHMPSQPSGSLEPSGGAMERPEEIAEPEDEEADGRFE